MKRISAGVGLVAAVALWAGCDHPSGALDSYPPGRLETPADLKSWAAASAPNVYFAAMMPVALVEMAGGTDAGCPVKTTNGNVDTYQGGCTAGDNTWVGTMVLDRGFSDGGSGSVSLEGFGLQNSRTCGSTTVLVSSTFNGTFTQTAGSGNDVSFKVDLRADSQGFDGGTCDPVTATAAWDYQGTTNSVTDVWTGQGRIGNSTDGVVSAETAGEQLGGSPCSSEAQTGTTTIHAGSNTAVITYDGQTKCDPTSNVTWTLNGTAMGEASGISCSAGTGATTLPLLALLAAAALLWRRRAWRRATAAAAPPGSCCSGR